MSALAFSLIYFSVALVIDLTGDHVVAALSRRSLNFTQKADA